MGCFCVAPHAGAWIETHIIAAALCGTESRLMQARGLKRGEAVFVRDNVESRLMQARGLKLPEPVL